ncbi:DUF6879 family protein [Nocardia asiatica]|uniref:DUF6879 family protein n=1 Tax=Nocardia asiatica TaxID=209252 RepID=UPI002456CF9F|nr:DUF6879 family protein [Nocardia asiatica]
MLHVVGDRCFEPLFRAARSRAFHLEVRDDYVLEDEQEALRRFDAGVAYEREEQPESWKAWDALMVESAGRGIKLERLRVVTVPHSDYTRWLVSATDDNIATGEIVRWLPRHLVDPAYLPHDDYWLFDTNTVAFNTFAENGAFMGLSITTDPALVGRCLQVRERLWPEGIDHQRYCESEHVHDERSVGRTRGAGCAPA